MQTSTPLLAALALLLSFADGAIAQIEEKKRERPFVRDPLCRDRKPGCKPQTIPEKIRMPPTRKFMRIAN
jgi:hypothetical protein